MSSLDVLYNRHKRWLPAVVRKWVSLARLRGINEPVIAYHFLQRHGRSRIMIDVGAAHGSALHTFAGDGWRVWGFEPNPGNRAVLQRVAATFPHVEVRPQAVSDKPAKGVKFFASAVSDGLGSLTPFDASHSASFEVDITTLAEAFPGPLDVDFLKVDTEGYDYFVLKGLPWERMKPRLILCEYDNHKSVPLGYRMEDMADFLVAKGYRVFASESDLIPDYGHLPEWRRFAAYPGCSPSDQTTGNLFAVEPALAPALERLLKQFERQIKRC